MDKYPKLRALLQEEWGGLYGFCKASDISRTTVRRLIQGRLGEAAEEKARRRIEGKLLELKPDLDLAFIWDEAVEEQDVKSETKSLELKVPEGVNRMRIEIEFRVIVE